MSETINSGEYGAAVMAVLKGAFDAVWRNEAIFKLHQAGISNNLLSVFASFLQNRYSQNLVNSHCSNWFETLKRVPQVSILISLLIFIVYTADLTLTLTLKTLTLPENFTWNHNMQMM